MRTSAIGMAKDSKNTSWSSKTRAATYKLQLTEGTNLRVVVEAIRVQLLRGKLGPEVYLHQARESLRS